MMYEIHYTHQFKKAYKLCKRRGCNMILLEQAIRLLADTGELPQIYKPHKLSGKYSQIWECHIEPDWLLLWSIENKEMTLLLLNTGTHSDIF